MQLEVQIQSIAFLEIYNRFPETRGCIWHIPNGGNRDAITGNQMKSAGVVPGIQDLHMLWLGKTYFIEMKDYKGQVDIAQKYIHAQHMLHGMPTYIFRTPDELIAFVCAIVAGSDLNGFKGFISPYSDSSKIQLYADEYRKWKASRSKYKRAA